MANKWRFVTVAKAESKAVTVCVAVSAITLASFVFICLVKLNIRITFWRGSFRKEMHVWSLPPFHDWFSHYFQMCIRIVVLCFCIGPFWFAVFASGKYFTGHFRSSVYALIWTNINQTFEQCSIRFHSDAKKVSPDYTTQPFLQFSAKRNFFHGVWYGRNE